MQSPATPSTRLVFDLEARLIEELDSRRREEARRKAFWDSEEDDDRKRKREEQRKDDAELLGFLWATALASGEEIAAFTAKLDRYDALTVEALQENERAFVEVRERIDAVLAGAVRLPDGRRVFKSADGLRVFDEQGEAVSPDDIRPEEIPDSNRRFESYWTDRSSRDVLAKEREDLLAYQSRLDAARETAGKKGLTEEELKALDKDIEAAMPPRLRKEIENDAGHAGPDPESASYQQRSNAQAAPTAISAAPRPGIN